jgi:hypothetical protein
MHEVPDHAHIQKRHYHTISAGTNTGDYNPRHNHWLWIKKKAKDGTDDSVKTFPADPHTNENPPSVPDPANWEQRFTSDTDISHHHSIPAMTTHYTGAGIENAGTSEWIRTKTAYESGYLLTSDDPEPSTDPTALIPWNQTRYNRANNTNPNVMDQGAAQEFSISNGFTGASSNALSSAHFVINQGSRTQTLSEHSPSQTLTTLPNVVDTVNKINGPQPYYTVNFIIKALP